MMIPRNGAKALYLGQHAIGISTWQALIRIS
jgi:hypothetical protein